MNNRPTLPIANEALHRDIVNNPRWNSPLLFAHIPPTIEKSFVLASYLARSSATRVSGPHCRTRSIETSIREMADSSSIIIDDFETILDDPAASRRLEELRSIVQGALARDCKVAWVSSQPASVFPTTIGSSPVVDATSLNCSPASYELIQEAIDLCDSQCSAEDIHRTSGGSRILIMSSLTLEREQISNTKRYRRMAELSRSVARDSLRAAGPELRRWLQENLLETDHPRSTLYEDSDISIVSQLRHCGLASWADSATRLAAVLPAQPRSTWIEELKFQLAASVTPSEDWRKLADLLFEMERTLRLATWAYWQDSGIGSSRLERHQESILNMAKESLGFAPSSLDDLANPLDWITLESLLDLCANEAKNGKFLGHDEAAWINFKREACPIRNRFAHMRTPRSGDRSALAVTWKKFLQRLSVPDALGSENRV